METLPPVDQKLLMDPKPNAQNLFQNANVKSRLHPPSIGTLPRLRIHRSLVRVRFNFAEPDFILLVLLVLLASHIFFANWTAL